MSKYFSMSNESPNNTAATHLQQLLIGYLVAAKTSLDDTQYETVKNVLPSYLALANEMVTVDVLADRGIMQQAVHSLAAGNTVEETLMYTFMLHIYLLLRNGTRHPLEMGIIRQKIIGLLPVFNRAREKGFIRDDVFSSNESLLMSIADKTEDMEEAVTILAAGYQRFATQSDGGGVAS
jgi:hypothetical protein